MDEKKRELAEAEQKFDALIAERTKARTAWNVLNEACFVAAEDLVLRRRQLRPMESDHQWEGSEART